MRTMVEIYSDVIAVSYYVFFLAIGLLAVREILLPLLICFEEHFLSPILSWAWRRDTINYDSNTTITTICAADADIPHTATQLLNKKMERMEKMRNELEMLKKTRTEIEPEVNINTGTASSQLSSSSSSSCRITSRRTNRNQVPSRGRCLWGHLRDEVGNRERSGFVLRNPSQNVREVLLVEKNK
ncbi:uncharacterized protein LOC118436432 [Folsomia candida]|nr:uncharacterized protein LOC118436432 [Folsomia candida]